MRLDISQLNEECTQAIVELKEELKITLGGGGVTVTAERSQYAEYRADGDRLVVRYNRLSMFVRLLACYIAWGGRQKALQMDCRTDMVGLMSDNSRNGVTNLNSAIKLVHKLAIMGYNVLQLYTEDTYEVKGHPYFGYFRGRLSADEIRQIDDCARKVGIELIPCIQTLAHLNQIFRWKPYLDICDTGDILLAEDDRTYSLIEAMFESVAQCFSSRRINIGMDEAFMVGLGQYLVKHGYDNRFDIINRHLDKVLEIAAKYGFRCAMWSDMYFRLAFQGDYYKKDKVIDSEVLGKIPKNIDLIYWDYYSTDREHYQAMLKSHLRISDKVQFAGGSWRWNGFAPDNRYAMDITVPGVTEAINAGIKDLLITAWGDNGAECSIFAVMPAMFWFANLCYGADCQGEQADGLFKLLTGVTIDKFMDIELINDVRTGYQVRKPNSSKYYLYNDCFMGIFDKTLTGKERPHYEAIAEKLLNGDYGEFGYAFATVGRLADVLAVKAELGVRTRAAYAASDKDALRALALNEYEIAAHRVQKLHQAFREQWMTDYKPHGFDVQDIRLGGLIQRLRSCRQTLLDYCNGQLDCIAELEENVLDFAGNNEFKQDGDTILYNNYALTVTQNIL